MNFGNLLSADPTNASAGSGGGGTPSQHRVSSGPPPGGGGVVGPGKNLSGFVKGVDGNRGDSTNSSDNSRRRTNPESLIDQSDPNHNVFGHVGGLAGLSHDLSFLEDMDDDGPPGQLSLKVRLEVRIEFLILILSWFIISFGILLQIYKTN